MTDAPWPFGDIDRLVEKMELLIVATMGVRDLSHLGDEAKLTVVDAFVEAHAMAVAYSSLYEIKEAIGNASGAVCRLRSRLDWGDEPHIALRPRLQRHLRLDVLDWLFNQIRLVNDLTTSQWITLEDTVGHKAGTAKSPELRFERALEAAFIRALTARGFDRKTIISALASLEMNWRDGENRDSKMDRAKTAVTDEALFWEVHQADSAGPGQEGDEPARLHVRSIQLSQQLRHEIAEQAPAQAEWADVRLSLYRTWSPPAFPATWPDLLKRFRKRKKQDTGGRND